MAPSTLNHHSNSMVKKKNRDVYTNPYVYKAPPLFMSGKLYWRIKKNGIWTWTPAIYDMLKDRYEEIKGCEVLLWWPEEEE